MDAGSLVGIFILLCQGEKFIPTDRRVRREALTEQQKTAT
jgi:hypothetical protein